MAGTLFISTMTGTLDGKGRVCIPATWRDALNAQATPGVYIRPSSLETALEGFGETLMQRQAGAQDATDPFAAIIDMDDERYLALADTQLLPRDENGRVRLPDDFIAYAKLKDRVTFVGLNDRFQIWDPEIFAAMRSERHARMLAKRAAQRGGQ